MLLNVLEPRNFEDAWQSESNDNQAEITTRCGNRDYSARSRTLVFHSARWHSKRPRRPLSRRAFIRACYFVVVAFNVTVRRDARSTVLVFLVRASLRGEKSSPFAPSPFVVPTLPELPIFFITFLISYPPASVTVIQIPIVIYVDINGNPRGCPVVARSPPSRRRTGRCNVLHFSVLGPDIMLYWIRERSCHCYCWLRGVALSALLPPTGRSHPSFSHASQLLTQRVGGGETGYCARSRFLWILLIKQHWRDAWRAPTKRKTDRPARATLTRISARRTSVENLYAPGFPFLSARRRQGKYQPSAFLKRYMRRCHRFVVMGIPLYSNFKNSIVVRARAGLAPFGADNAVLEI